MKSILRYFAAAILAVLALASCNKDKKTDKGVSVTGEWKLETFSGISAEEQNTEVYLVFTDAKQFTIYQKLGKGHFSKFEGTFTVAGKVLDGTYSDGTAWGSSYEVAVADGTLTMTAKNGSKEESVYRSSSVPASVKQDAATYSTTKAMGVCPWL